jgi:NitT/TauT family transport system permease protein
MAKKGYKFFQKTFLIAVLLALWIVVPIYAESMYVPSLLKVLAAYWDLIISGELWWHIGTSMKIAVAGLVISVAVAVPLGFLIGRVETISNFLDPLLQVMRNTSVLAILPLFVLILGIGDISKTAIIIWGAFFPTLINTIQGVRNVDPVLVNIARSMGIRPTGMFLNIIIPAASPYILAGVRLSASVSLIVIVGAEMIGARYGLGYMIFNYQHNYMVPYMYVGILTLAIIGVLVNWFFVSLEKRLLCWQEQQA